MIRAAALDDTAVNSVSDLSDLGSFYKISANLKFNLRRKKTGHDPGSEWGRFMKGKPRGQKILYYCPLPPLAESLVQRVN